MSAHGNPLEFGVTFRLEHPPEHLVELMAQAESAGFGYGWLFDNHIAAMEPYTLLALCAIATRRIRLGLCVTNPVSRHPTVTASALATLNLISGGRMDLGIGRGDSAVRLVGGQPASLETLGRSTEVIRTLVEGGSVQIEGTDVALPWATSHQLPVWIAGYGPRILDLVARVADGVVLQVGDITLLTVLIRYLRAREAAAGRPRGAVQIMVAIPAHVGEREVGIDKTAWYPRFLRHHLEGAIGQWADALPAGYVDAYLESGSEEDFRTEAGRTCLIGEPADHLRRIEELRAIGVDQVNLYLMDNGQADVIAAYGTTIIPALRAAGSSNRVATVGA